MIAQFFGLKKTCIHPTTLRPYIVSISGGKDISTENLQVFSADRSLEIVNSLTFSNRTASATLLSCSSIPSKTVITTSMMIQFTRRSRRRQHRHSRRQLSSTIKMGVLQVCNYKKSSLSCVGKNNASEYSRQIGISFVDVPLPANSEYRIANQFRYSKLLLSPSRPPCRKTPRNSSSSDRHFQEPTKASLNPQSFIISLASSSRSRLYSHAPLSPLVA